MLLRSAFIITGLLLSTTAFAEDVSCTPRSGNNVPPVQIERVQRIWLSWTNRLRRRLDLQPYVLNDQLNASAMNWATFAAQHGSIDHKRSADASYYDYTAIEQWFANRGLTFKNVNRITFTENIGWGRFDCEEADCTRALIRGIRTTYRYYLAERTKQSRPHYNSIVNPEFQEIGVGFAHDPVKKQYYVTIHYGTEITSSPPPLCAI